MIYNRLNDLLKEAMLSKDAVRTEVFRAIKKAITEWETSKEHSNSDFRDVDEIQILKKLATQYDETATTCDDGKHDELVRNARRSADIIREFLPAPVTEDAVKEAFDKVVADGMEPVKKNMGNIIKAIKSMLPAADGKMVSQVVGKNLQ